MSKKTLNKANLETLGAATLADLLMEVSAGSADIKRRLRLELSHNLGPSELARDVTKRLVSLRKSTSYVGWRKRKALIKDLNTQVTMIVDKITSQDPSIAFDLLWQFVEIAPSIYSRVDDSKGDVSDVFRAALARFENIAPRALLDPEALAARVWAAVLDNGHGEWDGVISLMAPTLGAAGLAHLTTLVQQYNTTPLQPEDDTHEAIQFLRQLRGGTNYAAQRKARFVQNCLQEIAAAAGDTRAYIAQYSDSDLQRPDIAAEVATLLCEDNQAEAALEILENIERDAHTSERASERTSERAAWDTAYIACLTKLERVDEAQAHRLACFHATLSTEHLRNYLKRLPDFDDIEAEDSAKAYVSGVANLSAALRFCLQWSDLLTAAQLVLARTSEINADHHMLLAPLADALRARHPLAAVLLWRAMIEHALDHRLSSRYASVAEHLTDCGVVDIEIPDYGTAPTHAEYLANLQAQHARKASFWARMG